MPTLYIGNRNYSSWSLRAWLLMRELDIGFEERQLWLGTEEFRNEIARVSPTGRVPVLVDGGLAVWDSLAIAEYLAERHPQRGVWPADAAERAVARSVCAEMHAGFEALRARLPMNIDARIESVPIDEALRADIDRIVAIWSGLRARHGARGPYLFGRFCAADAFFAPVASRFATYCIALPPACAEYARTVLDCAGMREWSEAALGEQRFLPEDEPYRTHR